MSRSAEEYVALLGLDEDDAEDVGDEMQTSQAAWTSANIPNNVIDLGNSSEGAILERLFNKLKIHTILPTHRESLKRVVGAENKLTLDLFCQWYLNFIFKGEDEDEVEEEERAFKTAGGLVQLAPQDGVSWRCPNCRVVNSWTSRRCIACEGLAPHSASLPAEPAVESIAAVSPFTFSSSAASAGGAISNGVFSFGAPVVGNVASSTGFSFGSGEATVLFGGTAAGDKK